MASHATVVPLHHSEAPSDFTVSFRCLQWARVLSRRPQRARRRASRLAASPPTTTCSGPGVLRSPQASAAPQRAGESCCDDVLNPMHQPVVSWLYSISIMVSLGMPRGFACPQPRSVARRSTHRSTCTPVGGHRMCKPLHQCSSCAGILACNPHAHSVLVAQPEQKVHGDNARRAQGKPQHLPLPRRHPALQVSPLSTS